MVFVPSVECSTVEAAPFHATTDAGLKRCARRYWMQHRGGGELTLDGASISPPGYVGGTTAFPFTMTAQHNFLGVPGRTSARAAVYVAASILRPLSPGTHTLVLIDSFTRPTTVLKSTVKLTVG
jgi:hypothetical protein